MIPTFAFLVPCLFPQTPCGSPGPDLTVGDIVGVANYASDGAIEACSFGFSPANVGSVPIDYAATTPHHPVIGQSLYRLSTVGGSTRFEEIGQSWVRHEFFALSLGQFCTCTPTDGSHLGVGCNDTNSASRNGEPAALGPRWQIDAATGTFPYPPANPPHPGSNDRRLQVAIADLVPTGGADGTRYFVEAQSVAPDDAAAGLGANNASYREVLVSGSGTTWNFTLTGTTRREQAAILAWAEADPEVVVSEVAVPGDGLFLLASRATDLGGGAWHYEYAIENLDSDRSARAFRVPLPVGGSSSNPGFHDVRYHSGDGPGNVDFDGTDWTFTTSAGEVAFATEDYATNPSANALRWGTTYDFRFDSDVPPGEGTVRIDLFKPGAPGGVSASAVVPFLVPPAPRNLCFGSGASGTACPCGNSGLPTSGCENSHGTGGATLDASGIPSLAADTLHLTAGGELPTALSVVIQGDLEMVPPRLFGDGLRCAGGALKRLYAKSASGGAVDVPGSGDLSVSQRSAALGAVIMAGETFIYQVYYRDPDPAWCPGSTGSTFNASSAVAIVWGS
jgi:hypothetical protein